MEIKIGLIQTGREIELEVDDDADAISRNAESALANGAKMIWFTDRKGRRVGVAVERLAYIEIGSAELKKAGFTG